MLSSKKMEGPFKLMRVPDQPKQDLLKTLQKWIPTGVTTVTNEMYHIAHLCYETIDTLNTVMSKKGATPISELTLQVVVNGEKYDGEDDVPPEDKVGEDQPVTITTVSVGEEYLIEKTLMPNIAMWFTTQSPRYKTRSKIDAREIHHILLEYLRRWYGYDATRKIPALRSAMFRRYFDKHTKIFPEDAVLLFNTLQENMVVDQGTEIMNLEPEDSEFKKLSDQQREWIVQHSDFPLTRRVLNYALLCAEAAHAADDYVLTSMQVNPVIKGFTAMTDPPTFHDLLPAKMMTFFGLNDKTIADDDEDLTRLVMHYLILHVSPRMRTLDATLADKNFTGPFKFSASSKDDISIASKDESEEEATDSDDDAEAQVVETPVQTRQRPERKASSTAKKVPAPKKPAAKKPPPNKKTPKKAATKRKKSTGAAEGAPGSKRRRSRK